MSLVLNPFNLANIYTILTEATCKDLTSNKNYQFCYEEQKTSLIQCLEKCEAYECYGKCSAAFDAELERCPCAPKCPCKLII